MTTRPIDELVEIVGNGGGLDIQAGNLSTDQLTDLTRHNGHNATIILRGLNDRPTAELVQIGKNHGGTVIFVLD